MSDLDYCDYCDECANMGYDENGICFGCHKPVSKRKPTDSTAKTATDRQEGS